jgi:hypothetical protein
VALDPDYPAVKLGDVLAHLDKNAPTEIQRPSYRHYFRPVFRQGIDITGKPGSQNLREDRLLWHITDWGGGEGQVVLQNGDDASARRFFRSEGLNARTAGQLELNKSIQQNTPQDATGGSVDTSEGSAWTAITGSITDTGTDTRLNSATTVAQSVAWTPGAGQVQAKFHLYKEAVQTTTVEGSSFAKSDGPGAINGDDWVIQATGGKTALFIQSGTLVAGTDISADVPLTVTGDLSATANSYALIRVYRNGSLLTGGQAVNLQSGDPTLTFTPTGTAIYQLAVYVVHNGGTTTFEEVTYTNASSPTSVTVSVRNTTDSTNHGSQTVQITNTTSAPVVSINHNTTAGKDYAYRVTYNSGGQRPLVDKVVATANTTVSGGYAFNAMEMGLDGKIWLIGNKASADSAAYTYDFTNEDWDVANAGLADTTSDDIPTAIVHSDAWEYAAFQSGVIIQFDASGDADYVTGLDTITGLGICQNRLFVLTEDPTDYANGVQIRTYGVDENVTAGTTAVVATAEVSSAAVVADGTLRERMIGTPTGARFFVNYSDVTCVLYEADASGSTLVVKELTRLDEGAKGTSIAYVAGTTFIAAQFQAEEGETPRCALYAIDSANTPRRVGLFRRDDPSDQPVVSMQPYQTDLWLLQGEFIWRYSLQTGGLYCEYQLNPTDNSYARQIAVTQGHVFACYEQESSTETGGVVWVAGSVGTYRQAAVAGGSSFTTSVYDYGLPGERKTLRSIQTITDDLAAATSVTVEAQFDQSGTWVDLGSHDSGAETILPLLSVDSLYEFRTIQLRVTLNSATGVSTPVLKAVVVECLVLEFEEFFELTILTENEDSSYHALDQTFTGGDLTQAINGMRRTRAPFTFVDGVEHASLDNNPEYLCVFDTSDGTNDEVGEGRMGVRLRVV